VAGACGFVSLGEGEAEAEAEAAVFAAVALASSTFSFIAGELTSTVLSVAGGIGRSSYAADGRGLRKIDSYKLLYAGRLKERRREVRQNCRGVFVYQGRNTGNAVFLLRREM